MPLHSVALALVAATTCCSEPVPVDPCQLGISISGWLPAMGDYKLHPTTHAGRKVYVMRNRTLDKPWAVKRPRYIFFVHTSHMWAVGPTLGEYPYEIAAISRADYPSEVLAAHWYVGGARGIWHTLGTPPSPTKQHTALRLTDLTRLPA